MFVVALTQLVLAAHYWCRQTCGWVSSTDISLRDPVGSSLLVLEEKSYGWVATLRKSTHLISDFSFIAQDLGVMISVRFVLQAYLPRTETYNCRSVRNAHTLCGL